MRVLNLLTSGETGGIESLCRDIGVSNKFENAFCFVFSGGTIYMKLPPESERVTHEIQRLEFGKVEII